MIPRFFFISDTIPRSGQGINQNKIGYRQIEGDMVSYMEVLDDYSDCQSLFNSMQILQIFK